VKFEEAIQQFGFRLEDERSARGAMVFRAEPNGFLTYWLHTFEDGTALLTWEFAIVDYLREHAIQLGSGESLNTFMFPAEDDRGPQEGAWLAGAIDRAATSLRSLRFDDPEPE
jgi:hypothetical protein